MEREQEVEVDTGVCGVPSETCVPKLGPGEIQKRLRLWDFKSL